MPYKSVYVKPKRFLSYKDVEVFHVYKENEADDQMTFWFKLSGDPPDDDSSWAVDAFDVRELPTWKVGTGQNPVDFQVARTDPRRMAVRAAVDSGELTSEGVLTRA